MSYEILKDFGMKMSFSNAFTKLSNSINNVGRARGVAERSWHVQTHVKPNYCDVRGFSKAR